METGNLLAHHISTAGDKAAYDAACKKLLANKSILAWIMRSCLEEYKDCSIEDIAEKYIEGDPQIAGAVVNPDEMVPGGSEQIRGEGTEDSTISEGTVTFDIRFRAVTPQARGRVQLFVNVEAQNDFYPGYPIIKRGIYYCSRMISSQYGAEFSDSHYERIKKVYSIWICVNPPKGRENTMTRYAMREENLIGSVHEKKENYDLLTAVMICLGREEDENYGGVLKLLDVLLGSGKDPERKKRVLQDDFQIEMTKKLESEVRSMCNLSEGVEKRGIEIGEERGIEKGTLQSLRNLMANMQLTAEQAMTALGVKEADREKYGRMLRS